MYSENEMYYDGLGYLRSPGEYFYDGVGHLRLPGEDYFDYDGHLRTHGDYFIDHDGDLRYPGGNFIDGQGYLRPSGGEITYSIGTLRGRSVSPLARRSNIPTGKMSNYSPRRYSTGNWQGWEIMIVVLMLIGLAMMTCGGPARVIFF